MKSLWNREPVAIIAAVQAVIAVALAFGAEPEVVTLDVLPAVAFKRNTHGIPEKAHAAQAERFYATNEAFPPYWKHTIIKGV